MSIFDTSTLFLKEIIILLFVGIVFKLYRHLRPEYIPRQARQLRVALANQIRLGYHGIYSKP